MIERYSRPAMAALWSDEARYAHWLRIEIAVAAAMAGRGDVPAEALDKIRERASVSAERIAEIEKVTRHDVIAFLECVGENVGPEARWLHLGLTSSDLLDTALALQITAAASLLLAGARDLAGALAEKAKEHAHLAAIGRTHGIHAEPLTYGLKFALWKVEVERGAARIERAAGEAATGKIAGAVGTFAHLDPAIEEEVLASLDLAPEPVSSQVVQRDRHASFVAALALLGGSLEKMATEIRALQRSDTGEVLEPFRKGQKGSSAMPHKRNPIVCERITGMARLLRGNALAAMENIALWHERDISHSSVERVILPDSTILLDYMLHRFTEVIEGLVIVEEKVGANLRSARATFGSQAILLSLARKGLTRKEAYAVVQRHALEALESDRELEDLLAADPDVRRYLSEEEIRGAFDVKHHCRHVDFLLRRAGIDV